MTIRLYRMETIACVIFINVCWYFFLKPRCALDKNLYKNLHFCVILLKWNKSTIFFFASPENIASKRRGVLFLKPFFFAHPQKILYTLEKTGILFYKPIFKIKEKIFEQRKHSKNEKKINRNLKIMTVKIFFFVNSKKNDFLFCIHRKYSLEKTGVLLWSRFLRINEKNFWNAECILKSFEF